MGKSASDVFDGRETEEERKQKAIEFLKICGFTSTTCCLCGKQVNTRFERLMQCARCQIAHYCSMKCVQRDFEKHKEACLLAVEFGSFLPPENPPVDQPKDSAPNTSLNRRKPKSVLSTKSLDTPTAKTVPAPRKSKSLYEKIPGISVGVNEPIVAKPSRVKKAKSISGERNPSPGIDGKYCDDAKSNHVPKKKTKQKLNDETKDPDCKSADDADKKPKIKTRPMQSEDPEKVGKRTQSKEPENTMKPAQSKEPYQCESTNNDPTSDNTKLDSKPKKTRKPPQRHKSSDEIYTKCSEPKRSKLRRNKSLDDADLSPRETSETTNSKDGANRKPSAFELGVSGLPKRVDEAVPDDKAKKGRNSLSGGRLEIEKLDVKERVRKLIANDGQCCYCGKVVPKHLMLECARCKLAYYCKMNCLQDHFDSHREVCNFVVEYKDYATIVEIDYYNR